MELRTKKYIKLIPGNKKQMQRNIKYTRNINYTILEKKQDLDEL